MLEIRVEPNGEMYDEANNKFIVIEPTTLKLEHSLISISKWEAKWHKPFLNESKKTNEEMLDYVRCMTLNSGVKLEVYSALSEQNYADINAYIEDTMTATWFSDDKSKTGTSEKITSELIYYWMVALNIPFECEKWHLNRLLTLVKVCNVKNQPGKKMSKNEVYNRNRALNEQRKKAMHTKG